MPIRMKVLNNVGRCQMAFRREEAQTDIPPGRHAYVLAICKDPGSTQEMLASSICVNKSTIARVLDSFEDDGYVERIPDKQDKRCLRVYPTEKLLAVYPKIREVTLRWNSLLTEGIDDSELEVFNSVLLRLENKAREIVKGIAEDKK